MSNIVIIVGSYYPNFSAVGKCMGNIADVLVIENNVTVICEQNIVNQNITENWGGQRIIRVLPKSQNSYIVTKDKERRSKLLKKQYYKSILKIQKISRVAKRILSMASLNNQLISAYTKALDNLEIKPDMIVPTCIPFESIMASLEYKKKNPDTVIIPILFDLFSENSNLNYFDIIRKIKFKANLLIEEQMLIQSKKVLFVENWKNHFKRYFPQYSDKCIQIEHPLLIRPVDYKEIQKNIDSDIHIVYTGVLDKKNRNPEPVLEILNKLKSSKMVFDFYGYGSAESIITDYIEKDPRIIFHGKVDSKTASEAQKNANVLLSIGNCDYSQTPSKLIEYFASGKLIIHFSVDKRDPAIKLLENYPNKIIIIMNQDIDINKLESEIKSLYNTIVPFSTIAQLYCGAIPENVANLLKPGV